MSRHYARGAASPQIGGNERRLRRTIPLAGLILCVGMLAGCGSNGNSTKSTSTAAAASGVATAKSQLAPYLQLPTSIGLTEPLPRHPQGKTVVYLECSIVNCKDHAIALREAFSHLGVTFKTIPSGLSPESFTNALETAKQDHPNGVIIDGIPAAIAQTRANAFAAAGVPVVAMASPDLELGHDVYNIEGASFYADMGRAMANWVIAESNGAAKVLYLQDPTLAFGASETQGLSETFTANCPGCQVSILKTSSAAAGTSLPPEVVSGLQSKPETTYVVAQYSALLLGVPAALKSAGIEGVKLIGFAPTVVNQETIKSGAEAAGVMQSNGALPWMAADAMARALVDAPLPTEVDADPPIVQLVPTDKVTWEPKRDWPYIPGWQQMFIKLWGT
jgi:ABC-type sugar transport system substrate-binding protein